MDPRQLEAFARRLGENPNDTEALSAAYEHGQSDPRAYAMFLEKAGAASQDPTYAAHWLNEAATVWSVSLQDPHRAARTLMVAVDKDPTSSVAADRLVAMYAEKGDSKSIAALHDRRTKHLEKLLGERPDLAPTLAQIFCELGQLYQDQLGQLERATAAFQKAAQHNPSDAYSIYQARELLKAAGRHREALPLFAAEQALVSADPERRLALYFDEAEVARQAGDLGATLAALRGAVSVDPNDDPTLRQQFGSVVLEHIHANRPLSDDDRSLAARLFTSLAETYDGEHGHAYAVCALECDPSLDRAAQLAMFYGQQLGKQLDTARVVASYLLANPSGLVAADARKLVSQALAEGADQTLIQALAPPEGAPAEERAAAETEIARAYVAQGKPDDAARHYRAVLLAEPGSVEAISYLADRLRSKKQYAKLRDLLLTATQQERLPAAQLEEWLTEVVHLCEGPLRDHDGAILACERLVELDPANEDAADQLELALEKAGRWAELAVLVQRRADADDDFEQKHSRYRRVATIHLEKRHDQVAAADALSVLARLQPVEDEIAFEAVRLYVRAEQTESAIALLSDLVGSLDSGAARVEYGRKLGELLCAQGYLGEAGRAYAEAASGGESASLWADAARCFVAVEAWEEAARCMSEQRAVTQDPLGRAALCAAEAEYLERLGDREGVIRLLGEASQLDPRNDDVASRLSALFEAEHRFGELVDVLLGRALVHPDAEVRMQLRRRAALICRDELDDPEAMRLALLHLLDDGEDAEALRILAADSEAKGELTEAIEFLRRLAVLVAGPERSDVSLRVAELLERDGDAQGALDQYQLVLALEPNTAPALTAAGRLQESLGDPEAAAESFKKLIPLVEGEAKLEAGRRRADLLLQLEDTKAAIAAYKLVLGLDPDDYEVVEILRDLSESSENWTDYVKFQQQLIEVEGDENDAASMAQKLAHALSEKLARPKDAMSALAPFARAHAEACRDEYIRLGDALGLKGEVAEALVDWLAEAPASPKRNKGLMAAYERFVAVQRADDAIRVGLELVRMQGAKQELARSLEEVASGARHLEALLAAFAVLQRDLAGPHRAEELVRQAEVLAKAGMVPAEAVAHGELGLSSIDPGDVDPLLARLAKLFAEPESKIGVYERQVARCKSLEERQNALVRGAEVAARLKKPENVQKFFQVALNFAGPGDALEELRELARRADQEDGSIALRAALAECLSGSGVGARDGGKTRSVFLSQAARIAYEDLGDIKKAFAWLGDALVAHVEDEYLDQLADMGEAEGLLSHVDQTIEHALAEVTDGPLVRALLKRRYDLREGALNDPRGAASDLKRLYELAPQDTAVAEKLEQTYREFGDDRGLVELYEDQILRCRDKEIRLDLSRKVAKIWQDVLREPRETADAWRRVLRLDPQSEQAREGLDRAKQAMRQVTTAEIARSEQETRAQVEEAAERERAALRKREAEMLAKADEIRRRHSQVPALSESYPPPPLEDFPSDAPLPPDLLPESSDAGSSPEPDRAEEASREEASREEAPREEASREEASREEASREEAPIKKKRRTRKKPSKKKAHAEPSGEADDPGDGVAGGASSSPAAEERQDVESSKPEGDGASHGLSPRAQSPPLEDTTPEEAAPAEETAQTAPSAEQPRAPEEATPAEEAAQTAPGSEQPTVHDEPAAPRSPQGDRAEAPTEAAGDALEAPGKDGLSSGEEVPGSPADESAEEEAAEEVFEVELDAEPPMSLPPPPPSRRSSQLPPPPRGPSGGLPPLPQRTSQAPASPLVAAPVPLQPGRIPPPPPLARPGGRSGPPPGVLSRVPAPPSDPSSGIPRPPSLPASPSRRPPPPPPPPGLKKS